MVMPELSVVVASRNDDHGGNLLRRTQLFLNGLLEQAKQHDLPLELLIVEWNPPPDRPRLAEALRWPQDLGPCSVRIIEVPAELHRRFAHSEAIPLFQMIGKNVAIRRARGRFILATNIDLLFSAQLAGFLASGRSLPGTMYRVDRYDVPAQVPEHMPLDRQLAYCSRNIIRIHRRHGSKILRGTKPKARSRPESPFWLVKWPVRRFFQLAYQLRQYLVPRLHTNGCGDFTLMAREHWLAVRGYAEFQMYSFYIDSLLCCAAHYAGAREVVLKAPMRVYHIEHAPGSGWTPGAGGDLLAKRLAEAGVPQLSWEQYFAWFKQMRREGKPIIFNQDDTWGLADESLPEIAIGQGMMVAPPRYNRLETSPTIEPSSSTARQVDAANRRSDKSVLGG